MNLIMRWGVDDDKGEPREVTLQDEDKDPNNNWHVFEIKNVGETPFKVFSGQKLYLGVKGKDDDSRRTWYGRNRNQNYETIEDNEAWVFQP